MFLVNWAQMSHVGGKTVIISGSQFSITLYRECGFPALEVIFWRIFTDIWVNNMPSEAFPLVLSSAGTRNEQI